MFEQTKLSFETGAGNGENYCEGGIFFGRMQRAFMDKAACRSAADVCLCSSDEDYCGGEETAGEAAAVCRPVKILWFDTETTGLDPNRHGLIQVAGIIEIDGVAVETFDITSAPMSRDEIDYEALRINGREYDDIIQYDAPAVAKARLSAILARHCDKFDKLDKFSLGGQNVAFDVGFLSSFWNKQGDKFLGSYINWRKIDLLQIVDMMSTFGGLELPNRKLKTICEYLGVELSDAHDALSDIVATRECFNILMRGKN